MPLSSTRPVYHRRTALFSLIPVVQLFIMQEESCSFNVWALKCVTFRQGQVCKFACTLRRRGLLGFSQLGDLSDAPMQMLEEALKVSLFADRVE
jgi:hypothetical protein